MNRQFPCSVVLAALFLSLVAGTTAAQLPNADPAAVQAAVDEARARLKLTPEQEAQLKPVMEERATRLKAIQEKHAGDGSRRAKREMYREARPVMDDYQAKVRAILDDTQEVEWEKMRSEARGRLKEKYREGQSSD